VPPHRAVNRPEKAGVAPSLMELRLAVQREPDNPRLWRQLADAARAGGALDEAHRTALESVRCTVHEPEVMQAALALRAGRLPDAETRLRAHLKEHPTDIAALRMLAELAAQLGRYGDAATLLEHTLELCPEFDAARQAYSLVLQRQQKPEAALAEAERLIARAPDEPEYQLLKAAILTRLGEYPQAIVIYQRLLDRQPRAAHIWMSLGHALKTVGRTDEGISAYRRTVEMAPGFGEAWWSLANLKTTRFDDADLQQMQSQLQRAELRAEDRFHLHFTLGKACEDRGQPAAAFDHYARGNALRRSLLPYSAQETHDACVKARAVFDPPLLRRGSRHGCQDSAPIFIVGMPRAGSTLVEQILASHPQVEGTMELPDLIALSRRWGAAQASAGRARYPEVLRELPDAQLAALGEEYLQRTRVQRKMNRPYFIDKMPNNWLHAGFIQTILPQARIIDVRRHPLDCCFSNFKQHFARGQAFTYDLGDLGRCYRDYVQLMEHFEAVAPGRIHRVHYEQLVGDFEPVVRGLLEYCGLPFDEACLRFNENQRAVRTASSEQVRQPLYTRGIGSWRPYQAWLEPLRVALGDTLHSYPIQIREPASRNDMNEEQRSSR
jgi:tetratricopeptide (TPR) repeat protein